MYTFPDVQTITLSELTNPESPILEQLLCEPTAASEPISEEDWQEYAVLEFPDCSFGAPKPPDPAQLRIKLENAITGMLTGIACSSQKTETNYAVPLQQEYLELALLISETYPDGVCITDILESFSWLSPEKYRPEAILYDAMKHDVPVQKIGAYQAFIGNNLLSSVVSRAICHAFPNACFADKAAHTAYLDAITSARGELPEAAVFLTAAISLSFAMTPIAAVRDALHGMPFAFIDQCSRITHPIPITSQTTPIIQCADFIQIIQAGGTMAECFERLQFYRATPCLFAAAGAIYGANQTDIPDPNTDDIPSKIPGETYSRKELARRLVNCNPCRSKQASEYPWKTKIEL